MHAKRFLIAAALLTLPTASASGRPGPRECEPPVGVEILQVTGVQCSVGLDVYDRYTAGNKKPLKFRCRRVETERGKSIYCVKDEERRSVVWTL